MVAGGITAAPVNPIIKPSGTASTGGTPAPADGGLAATDPIMKPEPAPAPDPVEQELNAPMKAAAPAPGSIGSAVSGPADGETPAEGAAASIDMSVGNNATPAKPENPFAGLFGKHEKKTPPNVAFNDPATQPDAATAADATAGTAAGTAAKKNKTTMLVLIGIAAVVIIVLIVVLVMQMNSGSSSNTASNTGGTNNEPVNVPDESDTSDESDTPTEPSTPTSSNALSCTRNMTTAEVAALNDAVSGSYTISLEFDADGMLATIAKIQSVVYSDEDATENEPVEEAIDETTSDNLTATSALKYELPVEKDDTVNLSMADIQANYESLDYTCNAL